jgi:hypothetical protein
MVEPSNSVFSNKYIDFFSVSVTSTIVKCRYHFNRPCFHGGHCGIFCYATCNIECCYLHLNPLGFFQRRKFSEGS